MNTTTTRAAVFIVTTKFSLLVVLETVYFNIMKQLRTKSVDGSLNVPNPAAIGAAIGRNETMVFMSEFIHIQARQTGGIARPCVRSKRLATGVLWLQGITLAWMLVECGVSLYAAALARSPAILAFGSDSLIELFSATVVLLQFLPQFSLLPREAMVSV